MDASLRQACHPIDDRLFYNRGRDGQERIAETRQNSADFARVGGDVAGATLVRFYTARCVCRRRTRPCNGEKD